MVRVAHTWGKRCSTVAMIAWIYAVSSMLQNVESLPVRYTLIGAVIVFTVVLIGLSIAAEQLFPFAAGLVFLGTLLSSISLFHVGSLSFPPDYWKMVVALSGAVILSLSPNIRSVAQHLSALYQLELFEERSESTIGDARGDVQILIRLNHGFARLVMPRCTVTIRHPRKNAPNAAPADLWNASGHGERDPGLRDHGLPFWVK